MRIQSFSLTQHTMLRALGTDLPSVLWCLQEESIDEGDGVGLDLLV